MTIKIRGKCSDLAEIKFYVNDILRFSGILEPVDDILIRFENSVSAEHYDKIKIVCVRGTVNVGTVQVDYLQDFRAELPEKEQLTVWADRLSNIPTSVPNPYMFHYDPELLSDFSFRMQDIRRDIVYYDKKIDIYSKPDDDYNSYIGWNYYLEENDRIEFSIDVFVPKDLLEFIAIVKPSAEYFANN